MADEEPKRRRTAPRLVLSGVLLVLHADGPLAQQNASPTPCAERKRILDARTIIALGENQHRLADIPELAEIAGADVFSTPAGSTPVVAVEAQAGGSWSVAADAGTPHRISERTARTLLNIDDYLRRGAAGARDIVAAFSTPIAAAVVADQFLHALNARIPLDHDRRWVVPEIGGMGFVGPDRTPKLLPMASDSARVANEIGDRLQRPYGELAAYLAAHKGVLGSFHAPLNAFTYNQLRLPPEQRAAGWEASRDRLALLTQQELARQWSVDLKEQVRLLADGVPDGDYFGLWHTHSPRLVTGEKGLLRLEEPVGLEPSSTDEMIARDYGQLLTFVYRKDGFIVWYRTDEDAWAQLPVQPEGWKRVFDDAARRAVSSDRSFEESAGRDNASSWLGQLP